MRIDEQRIVLAFSIDVIRSGSVLWQFGIYIAVTFANCVAGLVLRGRLLQLVCKVVDIIK